MKHFHEELRPRHNYMLGDTVHRGSESAKVVGPTKAFATKRESPMQTQCNPTLFEFPAQMPLQFDCVLIAGLILVRVVGEGGR